MSDPREFILADEVVATQELRTSRPPSSMWPIVVLVIAALFVFGQFQARQADGDRRETIDIESDGLHVLIAEETADRDQLSPQQVAIFNSVLVRQWTDKHCAEIDGVPAFRILDFDDELTRTDAIWQEMLDAADGELSLVIVKGNDAKVMSLPRDVESMIKTLDEYK